MIVYLIFLVPIALVLMLFGARYWRQTIIIVLFWSIVEGAARKWILPSFQAPILQIKDIALIAAYLGYAMSPRVPVPDADKIKLLSFLFVAQAAFCFLQILNPALPSPLLGIYGFKTYIVYTPLLFIMPEIIRTRDDLRTFLKWATIVAIPVSLLALYQFSQPPSSWVNKYVSHEEGAEAVVSVFGEGGEGAFKTGRARTSSTFSYIGGLVTFLIAVAPLTMSTFFQNNVPRKMMYLAAAASVLMIGAVMTTGSRTPIAIFAVVLPMAALFVGIRGLLPLASAIRLAVLAALLGAAGSYFFADAASALLYRAENADSTADRLISPITELIGAFNLTPVLGFGIGSNSNAAGSLVNSSFYWLPFLVENETARVMQDLGLIGFVIVYLFKISIAYLAIRWMFWSRSKLFVSVYIGCISFLLPIIMLLTINNPTGGLYYWTIAGLVLAMFRMESAERRAMGEYQAGAMAARAPRQATGPATT